MNKKHTYKSKMTSEREFPGAIERTIQISRANRQKQIDVDEVHTILTSMQSKLGPTTKIMVRGMNAQRMFTFKGFNDEEMNIEDFDEYYINNNSAVKSLDKFEKFSFVQIIALMDKPKVKVKKLKVKK